MNTSNKLKELEKRIELIENRNRKVELDKAWEISIARRALIALLTYFVITLFFAVIRLEKPFINAIVPTLGFILSTISVPFFKQIWIKYKK